MATTELAFALYGRPAGLITRRGGSLRLTYDAAYAQSPDATALSVSMPVGIRVVGVSPPGRPPQPTSSSPGSDTSPHRD